MGWNKLSLLGLLVDDFQARENSYKCIVKYGTMQPRLAFIILFTIIISHKEMFPKKHLGRKININLINRM